MAKKLVEGVVTELKKLLADERLVLGNDRTMKLLRDRKVKKVFFASNCSPDVREALEHMCTVVGVVSVRISKTAEEIGVVCRKPYSISVVGVLA